MKEELCEKVVEVRRVSDRVVTLVLDSEEDVLGLSCGYAPQSGMCLEEIQFCMMSSRVSGIFIVWINLVVLNVEAYWVEKLSK